MLTVLLSHEIAALRAIRTLYNEYAKKVKGMQFDVKRWPAIGTMPDIAYNVFRFLIGIMLFTPRSSDLMSVTFAYITVPHLNFKSAPTQPFYYLIDILQILPFLVHLSHLYT